MSDEPENIVLRQLELILLVLNRIDEKLDRISGPLARPMTPERARLVARRYQALAENLAGDAPEEAARVQGQAERWAAPAEALATKGEGQ